MPEQQFYELTVGGCHRRVAIIAVTPSIRIAFLDIVGDVEFMDAALRALVAKVPDDFEVILGGDTVGMVIAHHLCLVSGRPYVVARKKRTPIMVDVITANAQSIAAQQPSTFWLGRHQADKLAGRHVLIVDEVASTGSTLRALRSLAEQAGAERITTSVIATEGEPRDDVVSVAHLPVWTD